ncbi:MAG: radical SAM protein [Candidatus Binatia bacterium]
MSNPIQLAISFGDFLVRRNLKHLIVHVTNHCNFRCEHCFVDFTTNKRDLTLADYQRLAADVGPLLWLDIGGGEPFIRKDLAEIIGAFKAKVVHIPSNGSLLPQMLDGLRAIRAVRPKTELLIGLSLDGLEATHDRLRGAPGNYRQVWEAYEAIRAFDPRINIKMTTVISNKTYDDILPLMHVVRERRVDFHSVILLRGTPPVPDLVLPPMADLRRLGPPMFEILAGYAYGRSRLSARILRNYHRFLWNVSLEILERQAQVIPCFAGRSHMVVWGDGDVSSCEMLPAVGNLRQQSFAEIQAGAPFQAQVRSIRNRECHCTHNCAMLTTILFNPANLPQLLHQPIQA